MKQAKERCGLIKSKKVNKGVEAAISAIKMAHLNN